MYPKWKKLNSNGFTLIEIIASIALLGTIIAVLLPFFPQMMSWSKQADDELIASNLIDQVVFEVKNKTIISDHAEYIKNCDLQNPTNISYDYQFNGQEYQIQLNVCIENENNVNLYRTKIQIFTNDGGRKLSETYTYVDRDGVVDG
ncbi:prepilin-type N-terminal cleavage/methylation domain-containing protein [Oceanobacillus salinisoli]|uniref:prepilin-type N-terminal cleavage/methylation domain-containing protein n=1 Tax=Oceanobacillus salinisoli TaxID=2678611 RepID=UPI0012E23BA3|nr:type II secretion system protein [Oceanobacillus salinisoli]